MESRSRYAYRKRFFTPASFARGLGALLWHLPQLVRAVRGVRVSTQFAEQIMLAVTQVNGCRYCSYVHSRNALRAGLSADDVERLLAAEIGSFPEQEAVALAFAQHYAESAGKPEAEAVARLEAYYGKPMARDILAYVRAIQFANMAGNTVDAFLSRLHGRPAPNSSLLGELILFVPLFPFVLPLLGKVGGGPQETQPGRGTGTP